MFKLVVRVLTPIFLGLEAALESFSLFWGGFLYAILGVVFILFGGINSFATDSLLHLVCIAPVGLIIGAIVGIISGAIDGVWVRQLVLIWKPVPAKYFLFQIVVCLFTVLITIGLSFAIVSSFTNSFESSAQSMINQSLPFVVAASLAKLFINQKLGFWFLNDFEQINSGDELFNRLAPYASSCVRDWEFELTRIGLSVKSSVAPHETTGGIDKYFDKFTQTYRYKKWYKISYPADKEQKIVVTLENEESSFEFNTLEEAVKFVIEYYERNLTFIDNLILIKNIFTTD